MDDKISYDSILKVIGRLYLESQLEMSKLNAELIKARQERDQALKLVSNES